MTLRMGDGPVANIPAGLDAYAGYTDKGGIGITYPSLLTKFPSKRYLSISVHGQAFANCGDVEKGALSSWAGYTVGYAAASNVMAQIAAHGRPKKIWTAHYTGKAHLCNPSCGFGIDFVADGTQWTDHGGVWDESLLQDNFFDFMTPAPAGVPTPEEAMASLAGPIVAIVLRPQNDGYWLIGEDGGVFEFGKAPIVGSVAGKVAAGHFIRDAVCTPSGAGLILVGSDGGIFNLGDSKFFGSIPGDKVAPSATPIEA